MGSKDFFVVVFKDERLEPGECLQRNQKRGRGYNL